MTEPAPVGDDPSFVPVHRCRSCDQLRDANQALTAENARLREALEELLNCWDMRKSLDPGITRRRATQVRIARQALEAP